MPWSLRTIHSGSGSSGSGSTNPSANVQRLFPYPPANGGSQPSTIMNNGELRFPTQAEFLLYLAASPCSGRADGRIAVNLPNTPKSAYQPAHIPNVRVGFYIYPHRMEFSREGTSIVVTFSDEHSPLDDEKEMRGSPQRSNKLEALTPKHWRADAAEPSADGKVSYHPLDLDHTYLIKREKLILRWESKDPQITGPAAMLPSHQHTMGGSRW
ncbi:hypothetical protein M011DRAFT_136691 [Sporormia fimetaria CBS 119925]|uniref:Uncharacterized protein n=1 Tax=Sporormia fimetaria CBS 119925 TaxID=1340428 RepID=A0A6A6V5U2_9PLEO|nr:hypothetical protein M011DRAFT_136691 [Sporormia fimetaria CBS 119925]